MASQWETYNGSCWTTIRERLERTAASVVFAQEIRTLPGEALDRLSGAASGMGWQAAVSPGLPTEAGAVSSGAAVFVRKHITLAPVLDPIGQDAFDACTGRVAAGRVWLGVRGAALAASLYLADSEGLSDRNN